MKLVQNGVLFLKISMDDYFFLIKTSQKMKTYKTKTNNIKGGHYGTKSH